MTDLQSIQRKSGSWWRWLLSCWGCREIVKLVAMDAEDAPKLRDRIHLLELDLTSAYARIKELERHNGEHKEALAHVGRFIAASHRISQVPKPGTLKEILANAQRP